MKQLLSIGDEVLIGPDEQDGAKGYIEAVFVYRNFVQYVVTRWDEGSKIVDTVEEFEIRPFPYSVHTPEHPVEVRIHFEDDTF